VPDEGSYVIADEVRSLTFRYFSGTDWTDTWDGTQPGADGATPMGPPAAIEITMGIAVKGSANNEVKPYRHVVTIPTANNPTLATSASTGTTTGQ
jgi:hypothetical protein